MGIPVGRPSGFQQQTAKGDFRLTIVTELLAGISVCCCSACPGWFAPSPELRYQNVLLLTEGLSEQRPHDLYEKNWQK